MRAAVANDAVGDRSAGAAPPSSASRAVTQAIIAVWKSAGHGPMVFGTFEASWLGTWRSHVPGWLGLSTQRRTLADRSSPARRDRCPERFVHAVDRAHRGGGAVGEGAGDRIGPALARIADRPDLQERNGQLPVRHEVVRLVGSAADVGVEPLLDGGERLVGAAADLVLDGELPGLVHDPGVADDAGGAMPWASSAQPMWKDPNEPALPPWRKKSSVARVVRAYWMAALVAKQPVHRAQLPGRHRGSGCSGPTVSPPP